MNENTRNHLEARLRKMLEGLNQAEEKQARPASQSGAGNIIRRRAGEGEKRFSSAHKPIGLVPRQGNQA